MGDPFGVELLSVFDHDLSQGAKSQADFLHHRIPPMWGSLIKLEVIFPLVRIENNGDSKF